MEQNCKIILLGDMNVGKTAILQTLICKRFPQKLANTLGACYQQYKIQTPQGKLVALDIWDTAGQQRYRSLLNMYYKKSDGIILVFDVSVPASLKSLNYWAKQIEKQCVNDPVIYLVANKIDLKQTHKIVSNQQIKQFAQKHGWKFMYCSAKNSYNIEQLFEKIGSDVNRMRKIQKNTANRLSTNKKVKKNSNDSSCC